MSIQPYDAVVQRRSGKITVCNHDLVAVSHLTEDL